MASALTSSVSPARGVKTQFGRTRWSAGKKQAAHRVQSSVVNRAQRKCPGLCPLAAYSSGMNLESQSPYWEGHTDKQVKEKGVSLAERHAPNWKRNT